VPAGFVGHQPVGVSFIGGRWDEPNLIGLAYAFEQASHVKVPPTFLATEWAAAARGNAKHLDRRHGRWAMPPLRCHRQFSARRRLKRRAGEPALLGGQLLLRGLP
jgi:hypothetical protein